ncbi:tRNA uridine-5-carboxymethylaminomethyl(34) synthesis GTPase MnmE [Desulfurispira natronophila]|uniref:tRNA modification GTPase MnmE n=1 Tax=Desulfurispira natronophila TaxID=682562 RepID=A0A7W7Y367_9BACT|nr:tRNA modification GTPase [Desulfurispira natronophila]
MTFHDTIAAIATAPGEGAVAIVRISGPEALEVFRHCFRRPGGRGLPHPKPRHLYLGWVQDSQQQVLDQVLGVSMPGPHSFTGEDVVEFHCHGGSLVAGTVLEACLEHCRLAEPGEFSRRAFLAGKLDLTQAQAIIDVIRSKTPEAVRIANDVMQGRLRRTLTDLRQELIAIQSQLEATIEFAEEDIAPESEEHLCQRMEAVLGSVDSLLRGARTGMLMRQGAVVTIVGKPNVGKSSLLNSLCRSERSIVTPIPGTTRDVVEQYVDIQGLPVKLLDTAGLRDSGDTVEQLGMERTRSAIAGADLVLWLLDRSRAAGEEDRRIASLLKDRPCLALMNKSDLPAVMEPEFMAALPADRTLSISLLDDTDVQQVESAIYQQLCGRHHEARSDMLLSRTRQRDSLIRARESLEHAKHTLQQQLGYELVSMDLQHACTYLGEIMGEVVTDDVLDEIFSEFCIGK